MTETNGAKKMKQDIAVKAINTVRVLTAEMVQKANSGHPGMPMGCAPMAYVLYKEVMNYNPSNPTWFNRDRFVLSNGHGCALLYAMLHLTGYARPTLEDLKSFRQLDSVCAGHPENHMLEGVEVTTGPLGQGISNAVGMAMAERHLAAVFNTADIEIIDNYTYVFCGDGCLQEGISSEASSLAGHLKLGKLVVLYDDNDITIDGSTSLSFTEDVGKRYEAYGWQVLTVERGDGDIDDILAKVTEAKGCQDKPTLIKVRTKIGFGSKGEGTASVHGSPLGPAEVARVKTAFGFDPEQHFVVPGDVKDHLLEVVEQGAAKEKVWQELFATYEQKYPELASELQRRMKGELPKDWEKVVPSFTVDDGKIASRSSSGTALNALAAVMPELLGGSADLTPSNKTQLKCSKDYQPGSYDGRYFRFGVREHAMAAICNGLAAYGAIVPFCATFLNFASYALGALRLSALSNLRVIYIMTHDSIGLGEDGPTHQPVEVLPCLRAVPNFYVFRPADANEVSGCYKQALSMDHSPSLFALSRQNLPCLEGSSADSVAKGAYQVLAKASPAVVLVGTGSEVCILVDAAALLSQAGVEAAVVSMPCMKLFDAQSEDYKKSVFPAGVPVLSLEASSPLGWSRYAHLTLGMKEFGKSAPYLQVYEYFGFTAENVKAKATKLIAYYKGKDVPHLVTVPQL